MDPAPGVAAAEEERDRRLGRLQRHSLALVHALGALTSAAAVNDASASNEVDGARLGALSAVLVANVEGLLALIREVRLDVFLQQGAGAPGPGER